MLEGNDDPEFQLCSVVATAVVLRFWKLAQQYHNTNGVGEGNFLFPNSSPLTSLLFE